MVYFDTVRKWTEGSRTMKMRNLKNHDTRKYIGELKPFDKVIITRKINGMFDVETVDGEHMREPVAVVEQDDDTCPCCFKLDRVMLPQFERIPHSYDTKYTVRQVTFPPYKVLAGFRD